MKKLIISILLILCLTGCEYYQPTTVDNSVEYSDFKLIIDSKTKVVYIDNMIVNSNGEHHIYTPYYSKNGKLCKYDDERLMEIGEGE